MKKFVLILALLLLSCCAVTATAETYEVPFSESESILLPLSSGDNLYDDPVFDQPCYIHVQVITHGADGSSSSVVNTLHGFTVYYKFNIFERNGEISGGELLGGIWPKVVANNNLAFDVDVEARRISRPTNFSFSESNTSYTCTVGGGLLEVSYYSVINIASDGTITYSDRVTQQRTFYATFTGS